MLGRATRLYVCRVTSVNAQHAPSGEAAEAAVARLTEMSPDLRGCAVLDREGRALAASGDQESWASTGAALMAAADAAGDEPASHVHVATEDGEAFAVRHEGLVMVAVAERFTLASLMIFDMRAVLRDLAKGGG
jgi:hypothetical protein